MKFRMYYCVLLLIAVILAACTPGAQTNVVPTGTPLAEPVHTPTSSPTLEQDPSKYPEAVQVVLNSLSTRLGIAAGDIAVVSVEEVQWPDGCLGAAKQGEMCTQAIVDGYRVILKAGDQNYEFHTNKDGAQVREVMPPGPKSENLMTSIVPKARQFLSQELGLKLEDVQLQSAKQVDWPDSCLGASKPGQVCAQVITPGYQIYFQAGGKQYEVHTDMEAGLILLAGEPTQSLTGTVLVWEKTENGVCNRLEAGEKFLYGTCDGTLKEVQVSLERIDEMQELFTTYAPFNADTKAGSVKFSGQGSQKPVAAEQRSVAEWAWLVFQEAQSGRSGAAWGSLISWHREGGIAGFCDDLVIYASGWVFPSTCRPNSPASSEYYRLTPEQITRVFEWADRFETLDLVDQGPPGTSDAMTIKLTLNGTGKEKASADEQQKILLFAQEIFTQTSRK